MTLETTLVDGSHQHKIQIINTTGALVGGNVVEYVNGSIGIVQGLEVANNEVMALGVGPANVKVKVASNYAVNTPIYYDPTNNVATTTNTFPYFGRTQEAAAAANATVQALFDPTR